MKHIKLLTSIVTISSLSLTTLPTIASCSCSTGLQVELVSKKKDREFNQKTNGCSYTFKINNFETISNIKVKMVNLLVDSAETKSVAGLIKSSYDSAGNIKVLINTNVILAQWPNINELTFDFLFTNKETNETATLTGFSLNFKSLILAPSIETVDWSVIIEKADQYYEGALTLEEIAKSFGDEDGIAFSNINELIGFERSIKINNVDHAVRIVGINHDKLVTAKTASSTSLFTFELMTVLTDSNGDYLKSEWQELYNYDYTNSILRRNLTGEGEGTFGWKYPTGETKTALQMLPTDLQLAIKPVTKHVATYNTDTSTWEVKDAGYNDKLFPLTATEMAQSSEKAKVEGTAYEYWKQHNTDNDRIKCRSSEYWLTSPNIQTTGTVWCVNSSGNINPGAGVSYSYGRNVSFAFCI